MVVGGVTRGTRRRVGRKCCGRVGLRPRCTSALELTPPASSWAPLHFVYAHLNYSNSTHITSNTVQGMRYHTHTHVSHAPRVVSFAKHASDLTFALSGGSHAPRRHTRTHTTVRQMLQLRQTPAPFSPLRRQNIHTHTHGTHASRRAEKLTRCSRNHGARAPMRPPLSRAPRSSGPPYCSLPAPQDRGPSDPASPSRRARRRGRPRTLSRA